MFATTKNPVAMILGAVLFAGAAIQAPASAGEPTLAQNEHAAQSAIVASAEGSAHALVEASSPTLARNEAQAQRAIIDVPAPMLYRDDVSAETTLTQNEIAAQRSIVDVANSGTSASYAGTAETAVVSLRSPANH